MFSLPPWTSLMLNESAINQDDDEEKATRLKLLTWDWACPYSNHVQYRLARIGCPQQCLAHGWFPLISNTVCSWPKHCKYKEQKIYDAAPKKNQSKSFFSLRVSNVKPRVNLITVNVIEGAWIVAADAGLKRAAWCHRVVKNSLQLFSCVKHGQHSHLRCHLIHHLPVVDSVGLSL